MSLVRSYLFVPADRPERYVKAIESGADAVIIDLEDAVPSDAKEWARDRLATQWSGLIASARAVGCRLLVRTNAAETRWFEDDLTMCSELRPDGVVLPKAANAESVGDVAKRLEGIAILPLIETAKGVLNMESVAQVRGTERLVLGTVDLTLDINVEEDNPLDYVRTRLAIASRAASLAGPVDGVCRALDDGARLEFETHRARMFGFDAKLCIHPKQVQAINTAFAPTTQAIDWAHRVIKAFDMAAGRAVALDGEMVDLPVLLRAKAVLAQAEQLKR